MTWNGPSTDRFREAVQAGDQSRAAARFTEAIDAYTRAMVVRGDDLLADEEAQLRVRIAECFLETGDLASAELALAPVDRLDADAVGASARGAFLTVHGRIALYRGRHEDAIALATEAWDLLRATGENSLVARALTVRAHGRRQLGQLELAQEDYADALSAARRAGNDHEIGLAAANMGNLLWLSGRYVKAREHHLRAVEIHEACGSETHLGRELFALAVDEFHVGNWNAVDALLTRCDERAERTGDRRFASSVAISRARLEHVRGRDPRRTLEQAKLIAGDGGYDHDLIVIAQVLADAAMERGDWSEAHRQLRDATDRARRTAPEGEPLVDSTWRLARCLDAMGDRDGQVVAMLEATLETAARRGYRVAEACTRRTLGRCLLNRGRVDEARAHLEASLATFRELRMKWETGRTLVALAQLVAETSEGPLAAPLAREAEELFRELGADRDAAQAAETIAAATGEYPGASRGEPFADILTASASMRECIERARRIAPSNIPVLITGETGSGKELFARAIHRASSRADHPFLAVNCAALSETLLESELFGHEKGSFTGATSRKVGIFEAASGGTVFLDEVGKAPLSLQAKLLRVLDTGEMRRVGGVDAVYVNVRIVAATNRDVSDLVRENLFLPDLLYRLRGFEIRVPALRERAEDIPLLFERFAARPASPAALEVLRRHDWPGNVREMRNLAESAAFLSFGDGPIPRDALPDWIRRSAVTHAATVTSLVDAEKKALLRALETAEGNRSRAARELGISRQTLYTKMEKFGIGKADAA